MDDKWRLPKTASELERLTEDQVMEHLDHWLTMKGSLSWPDAVPFWRTEWAYRRRSTIADRTETLTRQLRLLTVVIAVLTAVTTAASIFLAIHG